MAQHTKPRFFQSARTVLAALGTLVLATVGIALFQPPATAHAATGGSSDFYVDQEFVFTPGGFTSNLNTGGDQFIQPFVPVSDLSLVQFGVIVNTYSSTTSEAPYEFSSLSIHELDSSGVPMSAPIAGGQGELFFLAGTPDAQHARAFAWFPDRPVLTAGVQYAALIDPTIAAEKGGGHASFPMALNGPAENKVMQATEGAWIGQGYTGHTYFEVTAALPLVEISPTAPTLTQSTECDVPGSVQIPTDVTGVDYASVTEGSTVTVTVTPQDGFIFSQDTVSSWEFSVEAKNCDSSVPPVDPVDPKPTPDPVKPTPAKPTAVSPAPKTLANTGSPINTGLVIGGVGILVAAGIGAMAWANHKKKSK